MSTLNIVPSVPTNTQNEVEQLKAQLEAMRAENASLKSKASQKGSLIKITPKGGLSVYGLGRFPVTLYKSQWIKLIAMVEEIKAFIQAHDSELTDKAKDNAEQVA